MKKLILPLFLLISCFIFGQGNPMPVYQQFGNNVTLTDFKGAARGVKGVVIGRYADTTTANNNALSNFIKYYPGAFIVTNNPIDELWQRNYNATAWINRGSLNITSITFITDSSVVFCFGNNVCDTVSINNFQSNVTQINDSTVLICTGISSCDTIHLGNSNSYYFLSPDTLVTCDTLETICIGDSCYQQQICDTIPVPRVTGLIFQNGVGRTRENNNIVEFGQPFPGEGGPLLYRNTWLYTGGSIFTIEGKPSGYEPFSVQQTQVIEESPSIQSWYHRGRGYTTGIDDPNTVNLYFNYTDPFYKDSSGFVFDRIGYLMNTNGRGGRYAMGYDNVSSKQTGFLLHTLDTANTDAMTIFGRQVPEAMAFTLNPPPTETWYENRIAVFKTTGQQQNPKYGDGLFTGAPTYTLQVDVDGNIIEGTVVGGSVITIINDTTINICSVIAASGSTACDTFIVNNVGVIQTVTILNDSTLLVCGTIPPCDTLHIPQTTLSQSITANNGLIMSTPTNVQLGSPTPSGAPLLHDTYIGDASNYKILATSIVTGTFSTIESYNTSTGGGLLGSALSGGGVTGTATSGYGGGFRATTGVGLTATSVSSFAAMFNITPATTNTVADIISISRQSTGTAANGIGTSVNFNVQTSNSVIWPSNQIISKWTDATTATRTSQYIVTGVNNAITADLFTLSGNGALKMNKYGVGSFTSGTATYLIATDAGGNWFEYPSGGIAGGLITADNGLTMSTATNAQLGGTLLKNTTIDATASFTLTVTGAATGSGNVMNVNNTSSGHAILTSTTSGYGLFATATTGRGVYGTATSGYGVRGNATSGTAIYGSTTSGITGILIQTPTTANDVTTVFQVAKLTSGNSGNGQNGIGAAIDFALPTTTSAGTASTSIGSIVYTLTDATHASRTSTLTLKGTLNATTVDLLTLAGNGSVKLRPITATEASAITPAEGMIIMVSSTNGTFLSIGGWMYYNAAWHAL
jgi:hypothetical protein